MKVNEMRAKSKSELGELRLAMFREQFNLRMQKAAGQLSKPDQIKKVRRDIARINTIITEKEQLA